MPCLEATVSYIWSWHSEYGLLGALGFIIFQSHLKESVLFMEYFITLELTLLKEVRIPEHRWQRIVFFFYIILARDV